MELIQIDEGYDMELYMDKDYEINPCDWDWAGYTYTIPVFCTLLLIHKVD